MVSYFVVITYRDSREVHGEFSVGVGGGRHWVGEILRYHGNHIVAGETQTCHSDQDEEEVLPLPLVEGWSPPHDMGKPVQGGVLGEFLQKVDNPN